MDRAFYFQAAYALFIHASRSEVSIVKSEIKTNKELRSPLVASVLEYRQTVLVSGRKVDGPRPACASGTATLGAD